MTGMIPIVLSGQVFALCAALVFGILGVGLWAELRRKGTKK